MTIVVDPGSFTKAWMQVLPRLMPDEEFVTNRDTYDPHEVEFVVSWKHPTEKILGYTNLKAMVLSSAGFDHIAAEVREKVPVVRLLDPAMANDIALYCLSWVIHFQRDFDVFARNQAKPEWTLIKQVFPRDFTVGVLGRGQIGTVVAEMMEAHGYETVGWSRSDHDRQLKQFFADCDVVISLLPNSDATRGLIDADLLAALGRGVLINVGRGPTVDSAALINALDGELRAAVLDVFGTEPLPEDDPLWAHPKVTITPHVAGRTNPTTAAAVVANNIRQLRAGIQPDGLVPLPPLS